MLVNNETGAIYDVKRVSDIVKKANPAALIHTDCTQAFLKIRFTAKDLGADMITLSAHKIGGPKGIGALWIKPEMIRKGLISPIIFGGGQENGLRSGTENVIGIAGFGAAAKVGYEKLDENIATITDIHDKMVAMLSDRSRFPGVELNIPDGPSAPHIISILMPMIRSEVMLHALEHNGVFVSSGSACSSNTGEISYVLQSFGLTSREADSTIRVSIGVQNTLADADGFVDEFENLLTSLMRMGRSPR